MALWLWQNRCTENQTTSIAKKKFAKLITGYKYAVQQPPKNKQPTFQKSHFAPNRHDETHPSFKSYRNARRVWVIPLKPLRHSTPRAQTKMQNFCNNIIIFFLSCIAFIIVCRIFYCPNSNWAKANVQLLFTVLLFLDSLNRNPFVFLWFSYFRCLFPSCFLLKTHNASQLEGNSRHWFINRLLAAFENEKRTTAEKVV